ncbi:MAG: hypothetical protein FJ090_00865 [Deltaproteobacteria bacterium]|nr:hypothetical protein [Deltaproteobacteria bacterium]
MIITLALAWSQDAPAEPPPAPIAVGDDEVDETVIVTGEAAVLRARDELVLKLRGEGYVRHERDGEYTVFKNDTPYLPQVWLHDDGWLQLKAQPPRVHSPGHSFANQGSPLNYLWCIPTLMTACVSVGSAALGPRQLQTAREDVVDATRPEVQKLNDAVVRQHLAQRLYKDIPADLERIWGDQAAPAIDRRRTLFLYWDSRTETDAGMAAKEAIRAFMKGVVQQSADPYTPGELEALNGARQTGNPLVL